MHDYLIDEINELRKENRLLWEEVEARRAAAAELLQALTLPPGQRCGIQPLQARRTSLGDSAAAHPAEARQAFRADEVDRLESAMERLVQQLGQTTEVLAQPDIHALVEQVDHLNAELARLQEQVRTLHRRQALAVSIRDSPSEGATPRLEPLHATRPDVIIESTYVAGLWQRLKQPWYYLPLAWGTIAIVFVLVVLLVFFD